MNVSHTNIISYIIHYVYIFVTLVPSWLTQTKWQSKHQGMYYSLLKNEHNDTYYPNVNTHD